MDPVTHTLVGVGMANAFLRKRIGPPAVPVLALASNLPDIDAVVHLTGDPTAILMRRTFGHSVFLLPLWSLGLALILRRFYPRLGFGRLFGLTLLGAFVHLFFDLVNSFGLVLLWPFSDWRPELAIIFIIDLVLTGLLAAPLLLAVFRRLRPHLILMSRIAMIGVAVYILFCEGNRMIARQALASESVRLTARPEFRYVFPEPLGPHRWRGVVRTGDTYRIYLIHTLSGRIEFIGEAITAVGQPAVEQARVTALGRRLEWFFKAPVWTVEGNPASTGRSANDPVVVSVFDLRFRSSLISREGIFVYRFRVFPDGRVEAL
ncbi:MAG: metal-dependent hydrolase [Nitrospirae bacterium]|nr:metal-dependent hydrolase [Nitrospirota bacterium]